MKFILISIIFVTLAPISKANNVTDEIVQNFLRPYKIEKTRNILLGGTLITASMVYIDRDFDKHNQAQISKHNFSEKICKEGNEKLQIVPNLIYFLANGILGYTSDNGSVYTKRAVDMFNATFYSSLTTNIIKPIINEKRPSGGNYSFPSGHTTSAFAFASYVAMEHEWYWGVPAYLCASLVGYSRIATNFHYPHDVLMGAAIGMSYGLAQYYKNYLDEISYTPMIMPTGDGQGIKLLVTKEF